MNRNKSLNWIIVCICSAAFFAGCAQPSSIRENEQSIRETRRNVLAQLNIYYDNTSGKVGYHFVSVPRSNCPVTWNSNNPEIVYNDPYAYSKPRVLPPGLELNGFNIEGTPEAPGNWVVKLRFDGITCQGKSYPAEDVTVQFNIQGDAPRKVK